MERNLTLPQEGILNIRSKLTFGQIEVVSGSLEQFELIIAGDEDSVSELRVELSGDSLVIAQPQLSYAKEILPLRRWLQICLRIPKAWKGSVDISTISGMIGARSLWVTEISLTTVSGTILARSIECGRYAQHSVTGTATGEAIQAGYGYLRTVSGKIIMEDALFQTAKVFTVSGEVSLAMKDGGKTLDMQSISAPLCVQVNGPVQAALHSISGQFLLAEDIPQAEGGLEISVSSVSGDLAVKRRG